MLASKSRTCELAGQSLDGQYQKSTTGHNICKVQSRKQRTGSWRFAIYPSRQTCRDKVLDGVENRQRAEQDKYPSFGVSAGVLESSLDERDEEHPIWKVAVAPWR